jgi:hypothetical protein
MPYLVANYTGAQARERARYLAPGATPVAEDVIEKIERLIINGSSFSDSGDDWCEFRAFDAVGNGIAYQRVNGY